MPTLLNNNLIPIIAIIGLVVLVALDKASADVAIPIIAGLAGLHTGLNATPNPPAAVVPVQPPPKFASVTDVTGNQPK